MTVVVPGTGAANGAPVPGHHVAGTRPYPWPYDGVLAPAGTGLVLVACQRWWATRCVDTDEALQHLAALWTAARDAGVGSYLTVHSGPVGTRAGAREYLPPAGSSAADLVVEPDGATPVPATGLDACYGGPFEATLRAAGIHRLILAGLGLEGPVHSTMRGLNDQGYECLLVEDACASGGPPTRAGAISSVLMSGGIFGAVGTTAAVIDALNKQ
jgi:nicotinamidase-related amidase